MSLKELIPAEVRLRWVKILLVAAGLYGVLYVLGVQKSLRDDAEGMGALLQIIGTLYSVLYAFATYVILGQFTAVEDEILKESGSLKDLLRLQPSSAGENPRPYCARHQDLRQRGRGNRMEIARTHRKQR